MPLARIVGPTGLLVRFVIGAVASVFVSSFIAGSIVGTLGITASFAGLLTSSVLAIALLVLSRHLLRSEGATLASLGLVPNRTRTREFVFGLVVSAVLFLGVAAVQSTIVGAPWEFQGPLGLKAAFVGLGASAILVLTEELLAKRIGEGESRHDRGQLAAHGVHRRTLT